MNTSLHFNHAVNHNENDSQLKMLLTKEQLINYFILCFTGMITGVLVTALKILL